MNDLRDPIAAGRRDLLVGSGVLAALAVVAYLSTVALSGGPLRGGTPVRVALAPDGPILRPGAEVRIGGERAGDVKSVSVDATGRRAVASLRVDRGTVGAGASARVRLRGMAGAVYLELSPGDAHRPLPRNPLISGRPAVQLTDVVAAFDRSTRVALADTLRGFGGGLTGNGSTLNRTLALAPRALAGATPLLEAMATPTGSLNGLLGAADTVANAAAPAGPERQQLGESVSAARATIGALAAHRAALGASIAAAPPLERAAAAVLPDADRLLGHTTLAAKRLRPALQALAAATTPLRHLAADTAQLASLERLARDALPALRALAPALPAIKGTASGLAGATPSLSVLAQALAPYRTELIEAPAGFDRWGAFTYNQGAGAGHKAVRFSMIFTCATARNPYPAAGRVSEDRKACR